MKLGKHYQLRIDPKLGDYSGSLVVVKAGPRGEGPTKQYRVSWGDGNWDVDWINIDMFEGCKCVEI